MDPRERDIAEVAVQLRERLIEERRTEAAAGREPAAGIEGAIRDLVERDAAIAPAADRDAIAARIVRDTVGLVLLWVKVISDSQLRVFAEKFCYE